MIYYFTSKFLTSKTLIIWINNCFFSSMTIIKYCISKHVGTEKLHTNSYTHTHIHTRTHKCIQACIQGHLHTHFHTYLWNAVCIHCTHKHIDVYIWEIYVYNHIIYSWLITVHKFIPTCTYSLIIGRQYLIHWCSYNMQHLSLRHFVSSRKTQNKKCLGSNSRERDREKERKAHQKCGNFLKRLIEHRLHKCP